jgi:hypothetical protein
MTTERIVQDYTTVSEAEIDEVASQIDWRQACQRGNLRDAKYHTKKIYTGRGYLLVARAFPQDNLLGFGTPNGGVRIVALDSLELVADLLPQFGSYTRGIDMNSDVIAASSTNPDPVLWDKRTHAHLTTFTGAAGDVNWCQLEDSLLFGSSDDEYVHQWDPRTAGDAVQKYHGDGPCYFVQVQGNVMLNTSGDTVCEWDRRNASHTLRTFKTEGTARALHFDDAHVAVSSLDGGIYFLNRDFSPVRCLFFVFFE